METIIVSQEQLEALVEQKVRVLLSELGHIPTHITARAGWKICGSRARFERLCDIGAIKPISIDGYKVKKYLRQDVIRASRGEKLRSKKIQL